MLSCTPAADQPRATLIVCPLSVVASWQFQMEKFIRKGHWNIEVYLGPNRQKLLNRIKKKNNIDVVLTSYETLLSDWKQYQQFLNEDEEKKAPKKKKQKKSRKDLVRDACKCS